MATPQLNLELRNAQQLVLTPQLQQAISLLQLNNLELHALLATEAAQNPLLEVLEPGVDSQAERDEAPVPPPETHAEDRKAARDTHELFDDSRALPGNRDNDLTGDFSSHWDGDEAPIGPRATLDYGDTSGSFSGGDEDSENTPFNRASQGIGLREHVLRQLNALQFTPPQRIIALSLLDLLDEAGYCHLDIAALAEKLGCDKAAIETVLTICQGCEPTGLFARNLTECLALQLTERSVLTPPLQSLLEHLDWLGAHQYEKLAKACGVSSADLQLLIAEVKRCNPKPASEFGSSAAAPIIPDVLLSAGVVDGIFTWQLELNPASLPRALVNNTYYAKLQSQIKDKTRQKADIQYLTDRVTAANWLIKALDQRANTILKVASEIVRQQDNFFRQGISGLKPLTLKEVADIVGVHESTVSRVTSHKYMATPRGLFELKYFFNTAITSAHGGEDHSSETVRQRIKQLISAETAAKILSDDQLVLLLQSEGINIARRTVAKYRESLGLPSSFERKRLARLSK